MVKHLESLMESARRLDSVTSTKLSDIDFMTTACLSVQHDARYDATVEVMLQREVSMSRKKVVDVLVDAERRQKMITPASSSAQTALAVVTKQKELAREQEQNQQKRKLPLLREIGSLGSRLS